MLSCEYVLSSAKLNLLYGMVWHAAVLRLIWRLYPSQKINQFDQYPQKLASSREGKMQYKRVPCRQNLKHEQLVVDVEPPTLRH